MNEVGLNIFVLQTKGGIVKVNGSSMQPTIQEGWQAEVKPIALNLIKIGDIVIMHKNGVFIVHRIIGKITWFNQIYFLEKGDNTNIISASIIHQSQIIGKVNKIINSEGKECPDINKLSLKYPEYLFCLIYFILFEIKKIFFKNKTNKLSRFLGRIYWNAARA